MVTETLYQTLLVVSIVAIIFLIFNLWRLYQLLWRIDRVAKITDNRVRELDAYLSNIQDLTETYLDAIKTFLLSFGVVKVVQEKLKDLKKSSGEKGEKNE